MSSADTSRRLEDEPVAGDATSSGSQALPATAEGLDDRTVISKRPPLSLGKLPASTSPQILGTTLIGQRLEHFELNEFVGGGGMGAVFRANDTRLDRTVAVKVLSRDHTDEETIRRFQNEAQNAARLDHPNIARVYYVGEDHGWNFIVFEFIEGTNLRDLVDRDGPLTLEQSLHFTLQVAEALAHSSSRDIVHRDIKPSNVLVTAEGQVKLVDMGLARLHQVESSSADLTASGVTLGTFDYISPEQARDPRLADVRSDIYSLGCTLYFMLTGQPPFPDGTALQKLLRHNSDEPPDVRTFRPELPPRVSALLEKMLAKRPSQREQSASELIAEIVALGQQLGLASVADYLHVATSPVLAPTQWRSQVWQVVAAVGLLVIAVTGMELVLAPGRAGGDLVVRPRFQKAEPTPEGVQETQSAKPAADAKERSQSILGLLEPLDFIGSTQFAEGGVGRLPFSASGHDSTTGEPVDRELAIEIAATSAGQAVSEAAPTTGVSREPTALGPAEAAPQPSKQLVVLGDSPAPPEPQTEYLSDLSAAAARAAELGIQEVELRYNGPRLEQPLELANQRLTVRAAADHHPIILFRPEVRLGSRQMIRLAGGSSAHVEFAGVELRLELPADPPAAGWALFAMSTGQSLELTNCVLTVKDGEDDQFPVHDQVAMISVQRRRYVDAMSMTDSPLVMGQQARVTLERTIARGEASLVSLTDETPLTIRWNQGLLVTSQHLIETGGSSSEPQYYEQIVLDLDHVTAITRQGLYHLRRGSGKAHQFSVNSYADRCVFVADAGAPLFEMVGLSVPPETDELQSTGDGNRFSPVDMPFLFVRQTAGSEPFVAKLGRKWSSETRSQAGVPWVRPPPFDQPAHDMTKQDFEIEIAAVEDAAGCDLLLLPDVWQGTLGAAAPIADPPPTSPGVNSSTPRQD
jgi:eukaryotic-like serine/threonine-protein kinase